MRKHLIQIITLVTVMLMMPQAQAAVQEEMVPQAHGKGHMWMETSE